jgi:multicomponent Na+:H+ antiporter subunit D
MNLAVLWYTVSTGTSFTYVLGEFPAPWGNELRAGVLEASIAVVFMAVMLCAVLAGLRYVKEDIDESKVNIYYTILNLMTAALMAMTWTNDIFSGYVFLEILTLTSCGALIVREIGRTTLAAVRYMILNLVGSGLFLLGVVLLYDVTGNLLMVPMQRSIALLYPDPRARIVLIMATGILTIGLSIKSGLFPFHYWMPDTYGWATPTSAAVLSSLVSKCYIFLLIKIYWRVIGIDLFMEMPIRNILFVLGLCGIIFGSVSAIRAENINRMVAFSSAAQIGYIYMGIGLGGIPGFTAAVFHIMAHAVTKSQLFLTTPRLADVSGGSLRFKNLQGCALKDPNAGLFFLLPSLSMIGIPIFAGFSSKLFFATAAADGGGIKLILVMLALAASSLLNALYFMRTLIRIYTPSDPPKERVRHHLDYNIPMLALTLANLAMGLFSGVFAALIGQGFAMFN